MNDKHLRPHVLTEAELQGEQAGRAYRGYCPMCGAQKLRVVGSANGAKVQKRCDACGVAVELGT